MPQAKRKAPQQAPKAQSVPEPEETEGTEDEGPEPEEEGGGGKGRGPERSEEMTVYVRGHEIEVVVPRDGNESDTLHRVAELVDGL